MTVKFAAFLIAAAIVCASPVRCEDVPNYSHPPYQHPFEATLRAAEQGDAAAQVQAGRDYEKALGVEQDFKKAINWYKKAADAGNAQATLALGLLFQDRRLSPGYQEKPDPWLLRAAQTGLVAAQLAEGKFHEAEFDTNHNASEEKIAKEWFERAAAQGDLEAMSILGTVLAASDDPSDRIQSEKYISASEEAYPRSRFFVELQKFFRDQKNSDRKTTGYPETLRRAALSLDIEEINQVGASGLMVVGLLSVIAGSSDFDDPAFRDGTLLRNTLEASARAGSLQSACNLAFSNLETLRAEKKDGNRTVFDWYSSAAQRGAPRAAYHLGKLYRDGLGTPANTSMAAMWFYKAAMHGYPPAEAALGDLLLHGKGVPTDYDAALGWLRPAVAYGNPMAQFDLGLMYKSGLGVQPDDGRAIELIAAAAQGTELGDFVGRQGWPPALDWIKTAQADPATSNQVADALARTPPPMQDVDSAEGGCDEQSINSKIEE
jgi:uncharacterized protein